MKKCVKSTVVMLLSVIVILSSVITVYNAVIFSRIFKTIYQSNENRSIYGLETTYHDFYKKYRSMKDAFSKDDDFIDLIPEIDFQVCLIGVKDDFKNPNTYVDTYVFYQDMIDQGTIKITKGRCIDTNHNGEDGIEIMVSSDLDVSVGDEITLSLDLYNESGKCIKLKSTVVGKYEKNNSFDFPEEDFKFYVKTGKYQPNILIQNIVDYVDFTAYTYYYNEGDFAVEDPYDKNIRLLPVYKKNNTSTINLLYEIAENNNATVFCDYNEVRHFYLLNVYNYLIVAVASAIIIIFAAVILMIFVKYNFRRKNDNSVKKQY